MHTDSSRSGTALPWAAFTLGATGSLAANLLDAVEAVHAARNGFPVPTTELAAALFFAALVPVALLLVVEMLIRSGKGGGGLTVVMWTGAAAVATGAAVMSFGHMYKVILSLGQPPLFAALMPLAVDGLMLVASVALARAGRSVPVPVDVPGVPEEPAMPEDVPEAVPASIPEAESVPEEVPSVSVPVPASVPEAESVPEEVPSVPSLRSVGNVNDAARAFVRSALKDGRKVTGKELADLFGKSDRWGRLRIADARAEELDREPEPA